MKRTFFQTFTLFFSIMVDHLWDLVKLNVVFLVTCLPLVTFGPACAALSGSMARLIRADEDDEQILHIYFSLFAACFRRSFFYGLAALASTGIFFSTLLFYGSKIRFQMTAVPLTSVSLLALTLLWCVFIRLFFLLGENPDKTGQQNDSQDASQSDKMPRRYILPSASQQKETGTTDTDLSRSSFWGLFSRAATEALAHGDTTLAAFLLSVLLLLIQLMTFPASVPLLLSVGLALPGLICTFSCTGPEDS